MTTRRTVVAAIALVPAWTEVWAVGRIQILPLHTTSTSPYSMARAILGGAQVEARSWQRSATDTPLTLHSDFCRVIEQNLARLDESRFNALMRQLTDKELASLQACYTASLGYGGHPNRLYGLLAERVEVAQLGRWLRFSPSGELANAIELHAPSKARALGSQLWDSAAPLELFPSAGQPVASTAPENLVANSSAFLFDYTVPEIYLHYRTAPFGSVSVRAALYMTTMHVGIHLSAAWEAGWAIGQNIVAPVIQTHMPSLWNTIGASAAEIVHRVTQATDIMSEALAQRDAAPWFLLNSFETAHLQSTGGDFGIVNAWYNVFGSAGSPAESGCALWAFCDLN